MTDNPIDLHTERILGSCPRCGFTVSAINTDRDPLNPLTERPPGGSGLVRLYDYLADHLRAVHGL